jgi:hypothetical protein
MPYGMGQLRNLPGPGGVGEVQLDHPTSITATSHATVAVVVGVAVGADVAVGATVDSDVGAAVGVIVDADAGGTTHGISGPLTMMSAVPDRSAENFVPSTLRTLASEL